MIQNKNIHILPTDKPSRLWMTKLGNLTRCHDIKTIKEALGKNVNIYITSDEEIKEVDIVLWKGQKIWKDFKIAKNGWYIQMGSSQFRPISEFQKIIFTTDQDLIKDGVQAIPDEFLEWFVNNPSCEEVKVIDFHTYFTQDIGNKGFYKIIIPKEELVECNFCSWTDKKEELKKNGHCPKCSSPNIISKEEPKQCCDSGIVDDFCINTLKCKHSVEEPKQETLEEAAIIYAYKSFVWPLNKQGEKQSIPPGQLVPPGYAKHQKIATKHFIAGYKLAQERSYSEGEVYTIQQISDLFIPIGKGGYIDDYLEYRLFSKEQPKLNFKEWFEQFKKK
tara:strand:+ start:12706 stop:13704 length:999 start_codon:yes stop_codon:yes gene_type:complete